MMLTKILGGNISHDAVKLLKALENALSILDTTETTIALIELVEDDVSLHVLSHIGKPFFLAISLIILYNNEKQTASIIFCSIGLHYERNLRPLLPDRSRSYIHQQRSQTYQSRSHEEP